MRKLVKIITSFFYLGHSPIMPGTVGSLGGLAVYFVVKDIVIIHIFAVLFLFTLGVVFSAEAEKIYKTKDPRMIVIDEACGMLVALFLVPYSIRSVIFGFLLFRIFDILKLPPARRAESLTGAFGIMLDDIIAALYTNIILQIITRLFHL